MATVAVTGASGLIGTALKRALRARGDRVRPLVRPGKSEEDGIAWDPQAGTIDRAALEGVDAVVHLAGESIAGARWSDEQKAKIRDSRVKGTCLLAEALADAARKPEVLVSASAIGIYGDRGESELDESSSLGDDFLAELGKLWEGSAAPAARAGIRVVHPRLGVVLDPAGGALAKMLPPFKLGLGGKLGSGEQYMSWIALSDVIRGVLHLIDQRELRGPLNLTAPHPVTNAEFTRALGHALGRPAFMQVPGFAARLAFGELADAALLGGQRVLPKRLLASAFEFQYPELGPFLDGLLRG